MIKTSTILLAMRPGRNGDAFDLGEKDFRGCSRCSGVQSETIQHPHSLTCPNVALSLALTAGAEALNRLHDIKEYCETDSREYAVECTKEHILDIINQETEHVRTQ